MTALLGFLVLLLIGGAFPVKASNYEEGTDFEKQHGWNGISTYIFEEKITEALEKLRTYLKENEPLHFEGFDFDFYLLDSALDGGLSNTNIAHTSEFNVTNLEFTLLQLKLNISAYFDVLTFDGYYELFGSLFQEIAIDGRGEWKSDVSGLQVDLIIDMDSSNGSVYINDTYVNFTIRGDKFQYTNEKDTGAIVELEEDFIIALFYRVRDTYFEALEVTLRAVANDLLTGVSIADIIDWINGSGSEAELFAEKLMQLIPWLFKKA